MLSTYIWYTPIPYMSNIALQDLTGGALNPTTPH